MVLVNLTRDEKVATMKVWTAVSTERRIKALKELVASNPDHPVRPTQEWSDFLMLGKETIATITGRQ